MRITLALAAALLAFTAPAHAKPPSQTVHDAQVAAFFKHHARLAKTQAGRIALLHIKVRQLGAQVRSLTSAQSTPRGYARHLAAKRGWTGYQWDALDTIIGRESSWDPCARNPGQHECGYTGSRACGVPQANPCPTEWRGQLDVTWRAQVEWLMEYIVGHGYGTPAAALDYWNHNGSY